MTTLAYRNGVLASDSQITFGGMRYARARKIARLPNGALVGICGSLAQGAKLMEFLIQNDGDLSEELLKSLPDVNALLIMPDRSVMILEGGKRGGAAPIDGEFFADGSGGSFALAAMCGGADAVRAVEIAADLDIHTSLPVQSLALEPVVPGRRKRKTK